MKAYDEEYDTSSMRETMMGVRVNTFNDVSLGEPEQDANSALTELDKGLRSAKVGEQCEAIVRFPHLFEKYPFPILINASLLKLADVFRVGNNFLRLWILKVCQQSEKHLDKVLNVDEFVRKIFSVIHSNDPVARALTLRTLGSIAGIIPELQHVHHSIRRSLDSHDTVEVEAAIYAANQFAAQSKTFALSMCNKMSDMIQGLTTPAHMKLQLIPILQHMHHDTSTAAMVRQLCTDLLPKYPAQDFVPVILRTLTRLALATSVDIPNQVSLLLQQLHTDARPGVQHEALSSLRSLAAKGAHLWPAGAIEELVYYAKRSTNQAILSRCLDVLQVLAKSEAACHSQLHPDSPLLKLCSRTCYSSDPIIAVKAVQVYTRIVCYSHQEDSSSITMNGAPPASSEGLSQAVDAVESLFLLLTVGCSEKHNQAIKICLQCAVSLCKTHRQFCSRFIELIGTCLAAGSVSVELCEALGAIGNLQPSALLPALPDILAKLSEMAKDHGPGQDQGHLKVMLCTLVFQCAVGYDWHPDALRVIKEVAATNNQWANFRIMRSAARYGHHAVAADLVGHLKSLVSSDNLHFWLVCLEEMSLGEAMLQDVDRQPSLEARLSQAVMHYSKASAALKAASTPAQTLQFQSEYLRLRGEFLQLLNQLVYSCHSFCTTPPAAIATSIAQSTRDDLQRYGHITHQLRKCTKEFRHCGEQYWNLYQSAFDADPCSLAHIQILQQMCVLVAHSIERVALASFQEETSFDCSLQQCSLETQHLVRCCREAVELAQRLTSNRDLKPITHLHIECLLKQIKILAKSSLCVPRYFFQVIQSTSVKLMICPQPRVQGESVTVQAGSQLALMVEGVIQHGKRPGVFRSVSRVVITVTSQLQSRPNAQLDTKLIDSGSVLTQTVTPHRDFFTSQFLLAFLSGGTHLIAVEASLIDEKGNVWRTGLRNTLTVKSHEEPGNKTPVPPGMPAPGAPGPGAPRGRF